MRWVVRILEAVAVIALLFVIVMFGLPVFLICFSLWLADLESDDKY